MAEDAATPSGSPTPGTRALFRHHPPLKAGLAAGAVALVAAYYLIGALSVHHIDDRLDFMAEPPAGGSRALAMAAALVEREAVRWVANDPVFMPGALLDDMPNFQLGLVSAVSHHVDALTGAGLPLATAADELRQEGTIWLFDFRQSWLPTTGADKHYLAGAKDIRAVNDRVAARAVEWPRQPEALLQVLDAVAADLAATGESIEQHLAERHWAMTDSDADDLFYAAKGHLYAHFLLLRELRQDDEALIAERGLGPAWDDLLGALALAARLRPLVVINGAPDALLLPSHLTAQGFYLMRASAHLSAVADSLRK